MNMKVLFLFLSLCLAMVALLIPGAPGYACTNPSGVPGEITYNADRQVFQGCTVAQNWVAFHRIFDPCEALNPPVGTTCADGTMYAGNLGLGKLFVSSLSDTDLGSARYSTEVVQTGAISATDGRANQQIITSGFDISKYPGFEACDALTSHGHNDWYLPAWDELGLINTNKAIWAATSAFNTDSYLASDELGVTGDQFRWRQLTATFSAQSGGTKSYAGNAAQVKCFRRE